MLRTLSIYNLLLIDRLELEFHAGLNVLTGETGAGKSILLDSLGFVLGWRGRADLVRQGQNSGEVTACFDLPSDHPARHILQEAGLPLEDELVLRRVNSQDGRKTAFVNDRRCSAEVLRQLSDVLIELHGQNDDRGLLNPSGHRALLDAVGGVDTATLSVAWNNLQRLSAQLHAARETQTASEKERDYIIHALNELEELAPQAGEEEKLDTRRRLMQNAQRIRGDIAKAAQALGAEGAEMLLSDSSRWLEDARTQSDVDLSAVLDAVSRSITELGEAQNMIEAILSDLNFDPYEFEQLEERLFAMRAIARKHQTTVDSLADLGEKFAGDLAALDLGAEQIEKQQGDVAAAQKEYDRLANAATDARHHAARHLQEAMIAQLEPLRLGQARFIVEVTPSNPSASGVDSVRFLVATNPGAPIGAINKIASGGELSRFLLALKVCLSKRSDGLTLIFDEIDRGVGGATAAAVGTRLSVIAQNVQVLVVTHSPQVAAKASHQWRVSKYTHDKQTFSTVEKLNDTARVDEIARMLSGDTVTQEARDAARALIKGVG